MLSDDRPSTAAKVMGGVLLGLGILSLAMGYASRKIGIIGMFFQFAGAYLTVHGTGLFLGDGRLTLRKGLILAGVMALLGLYFWITSLDASIWG
jgi:hypothetical protein